MLDTVDKSVISAIWYNNIFICPCYVHGEKIVAITKLATLDPPNDLYRQNVLFIIF